MSIGEIPPPTRIGPESNGMAMTPGEFEAVEHWEPGYRYELVRGVLIVNPPAGVGERGPNDELGHWLRRCRESHPQGSVLDDTMPEHEIATSAGYRIADRVIWTGLGRVPNYDRDVPRIAIEFVARSSRDRKRDFVEKRDEYAEAGVEEYWIIDRYRRTMTVFRGAHEEFVVAEGTIYTTDLLPGFELDLSALLEIADRSRDS